METMLAKAGINTIDTYLFLSVVKRHQLIEFLFLVCVVLQLRRDPCLAVA